MTLEEEKELERTKRGCEMFIELKKVQGQFSTKLLQSLLVLNGGAATALIALKDREYRDAAMLFAIAAMFAVTGFATGYLANREYSESWRSCIQPEKTDGKPHIKFGNWALAASAICAFLSFIIFDVALFAKVPQY